MPADPEWRLRAHRYLYESQWFDVRQDDLTLPTGEDITYTFIEHPGYAMVLPVLDDGTAVLVDVYRHPLADSSLECPAGGLDGGSALETVHRELEEETGYRASNVQPLGSFFGSPGCSSEQFHLFVATSLTNDGTIAREATEQMEIVHMPFAQLYERAVSGRLGGGPSTLCVLLAAASGHLPAAAISS